MVMFLNPEHLAVGVVMHSLALTVIWSVCTSNVTSRGVSYMCNRCSSWVYSKCSGLQNAAEYRQIKNWACISCSSPPTPQIPKPLPSPTTTKASDGDPFTILQFNAHGIGNKQVELGDYLESHKVKVAVIQESKLTLNSRTPNIQNFTTVNHNVLLSKIVRSTLPEATCR